MRTGTQLRKKSLSGAVLFEVTRTHRLPLANSLDDQDLPHVSEDPPRTPMWAEVVSRPSVFDDVHVAPPSHDSSTLKLLVPALLSSHHCSRTSIPKMRQELGIATL
jgi:hypothetical protein